MVSENVVILLHLFQFTLDLFIILQQKSDEKLTKIKKVF